jgi:hypothetical protein
MKTTNAPSLSLIVPGIKYADFLNQTNAYLNSLYLSEKHETELQHRINALCGPLCDTLIYYEHDKDSQSQKTYRSIELGLKEVLRRVRISLAVNKKHSKDYIGFWKYVSTVCMKDAAILRDLYLLSLFERFHKAAQSLK